MALIVTEIFIFWKTISKSPSMPKRSFGFLLITKVYLFYFLKAWGVGYSYLTLLSMLRASSLIKRKHLWNILKSNSPIVESLEWSPNFYINSFFLLAFCNFPRMAMKKSWNSLDKFYLKDIINGNKASKVSSEIVLAKSKVNEANWILL